MRWPDANRLIDRIRDERPELIVDHFSTQQEHVALRVYCILKQGRQLIRESLDTLYGVDGWKRYKERHPELWCPPEESYHTDALGREVDHRGLPVRPAPPAATPISAEAMLDRLVMLGRQEPGWWKRPELLAQVAAEWGVRILPDGRMADCEVQEIARIDGATHASVLLARTGSGLFASGYLARWGDGGTIMEPGVTSVPSDTECDARRRALRDLAECLSLPSRSGRKQRAALLEAVRQAQREMGLFG